MHQKINGTISSSKIYTEQIITSDKLGNILETTVHLQKEEGHPKNQDEMSKKTELEK